MEDRHHFDMTCFFLLFLLLFQGEVGKTEERMETWVVGRDMVLSMFRAG